jgi:hypothetical protein
MSECSVWYLDFNTKLSDEIMRKSSRTYIFARYILVELFNSSFFSNRRIRQIVKTKKRQERPWQIYKRTYALRNKE